MNNTTPASELKASDGESGAALESPRPALADLSDRQLDALVAVQVMAFTRAPEPPHPTDNRQIDGALYYLPCTPWDRGQQNVVPYFSSDIADAYRVVEKLSQPFSFGLFHTCAYSSVSNGWTALFAKDVYPPLSFAIVEKDVMEDLQSQRQGQSA